MHQSVKELRYARSKGSNKHKENQTKATKNHKQTHNTNKKPQPSEFPLQLVKQVKQVRRKPHRVSKQLVQEELLRGNQTILTSEHGKTLSSRILLPTGRGMHRHHWKVQKDGRRTLPPATLLHIEKTQWSPNCRSGIYANCGHLCLPFRG